MTREELLALPLRELDVFVAMELMEWRWIRQDVGYRGRDGILMPKEGTVGSCWGDYRPEYLESHIVTVGRPEDFPSNAPERLPRFSTDDNAARLVRNRIEELGLVTTYARELGEFVTVFKDANVYQVRFAFQQATPQQQCVAAILAVQEKERGE